MTSLSNVRFVVKLPNQKTRVTCYNLGSCQRYCRDLKSKKIPYKCTFYYAEPEAISTTAL